MHLTANAAEHLAKALLVLMPALLLSGCQSTPSTAFICTLPSGYQVESAFAHANSDLAHWQCHYQFDQYMEKLLAIAATDPKEENRQHFSDFLAQARDSGVLSQLQAQEYYRRYFTPDFVSLGNMHNNCSTTCRNQTEVLKQMKLELRDKRRGMLMVIGDRESYAQADGEFNKLLTLIDATCVACKEPQ